MGMGQAQSIVVMVLAAVMRVVMIQVGMAVAIGLKMIQVGVAVAMGM